MNSPMSAYLNAAIYWPPPFVLWPIPLAMPFWLVFLWARGTEQRILSRRRPREDAAIDFDSGSWPLINYGWRVVRLSALSLAFLTPPWLDGALRIALYGAGLLMMISGALLRQHCLRMLGDYFTYRVSVSEKNTIVKSGIYRWVRHPSYTGGMLFNLGIGLTLTNWRSAVVIILGMIVMYVYRVHVEEKALLKVHSAAYGEYMQRTKRFVPFVF